MQDALISFSGGAVYGFASVVSAQPLDTIRTHMQVKQGTTMMRCARELGLRGLYRGSLPLLAGGSMLRSAQFGVYEATLALLPARPDKRPFSYQVALAGVAGGVGRALVEAPFQFVAVRQQLNETWRWRDVYQGSSAITVRNAFLFGLFVINLDVASYLAPALSSYAFVKGALCANVAWLAVWPIDVVRARRQSGLYGGASSWDILRQLVASRSLYAGVLPGLARSTIANGVGMWSMSKYVAWMKRTKE